MLLLSAKPSRPLYRTGNHVRNIALGEPCSGPIIPFGSMVEYHPISTKDQSSRHQFGQNVLSGIFIGCVLYVGVYLERRHLGRGRWRAGKFGRVRNSCSETQYKGGSHAKEGQEFDFPSGDGSVTLAGRDQVVWQDL